ncbi:CAP domain-containing protein [Microvirga arabica]|uniref:CAP domain-containing protein n=2 Tax=Microvirga arabica TaxID=1128671 RepID=UPI001939AC8C|nr:CAP domain-containing protein [Microvirga arabica]MBM1173037.1 CAP domain-containing protein [Microvirga arabica]
MSLPTAFEQYMLELINAERAAVGARPLILDSTLQTSSERHSQWMLAADSFSHQGMNGSAPHGRMEAAGYQFTGAYGSGENIAWVSLRAPDGYMDEVQLMHQNLMNSPGHRANILNPAFEEIGIGIEIGNLQGWDAAVVTQNFGYSAAEATPPASGPTDGYVLVDDGFYLARNSDVRAAGVDPEHHYAAYGWKEGRDPNAFFDTSAYLQAYGDVAAAGVNPLEHYNAFGWKEGRDPSGAFDTDAYLATYTDVAAAGVNPLEHYLAYGIYEGRSAFPDSIVG